MVKWRAANWSSFTLLCPCVRGSARAHEVKLPWNNSCRLCEVKEDKTRVKRLVKVRTNLTCKLLLAFTTLIFANEIESIFLLHFFFFNSFKILKIYVYLILKFQFTKLFLYFYIFRNTLYHCCLNIVIILQYFCCQYFQSNCYASLNK